MKTTDHETSEEHAYEDNWYRSLKALAEQRSGQTTDVDQLEVGSAAEAPPTEGLGTGEVPTDERSGDVPPPAAPSDTIPPAELEMRAGQLLERLRTLQGLSTPEQEDQVPPSAVWPA